MTWTFRNMDELVQWLRKRANEADAKSVSLARCKSDKMYFRGQAFAFRDLATMLEKHEIQFSGFTIEPTRI